MSIQKIFSFTLLSCLLVGTLGYVASNDHPKINHHGHGSNSGAVSSQSIIQDHSIEEIDHHHHHDHEEHNHHEEKAYPKYEFKYSVDDEHTQDQKDHWESRDGEIVTGQYSFRQPDGSVRTVTYTADKNGYRAEVSTTAPDPAYEHEHGHGHGNNHLIEHDHSSHQHY